MPIKINPWTGESYIPLPAPLSNIIITPPRRAGPGLSDPDPADCAAMVSFLNDPRVYMYLVSTPYPYLLSHAEDWIGKSCAESERILAVAGEGQDGSVNYVDGCPFRCIREIIRESDADVDGDDGWEKDMFIGDVGIMRYPFYELPDGSDEQKEARERNAKLDAGNEEVIWSLGDFLSPSYHGRGIMSAVVRAVMDEWVVPRMNARIIKVSAYVGNVGSVRVFQKNGFQIEHTLEDWAIIPENRGGGRKSIYVLGWKAPA